MAKAKKCIPFRSSFDRWITLTVFLVDCWLKLACTVFVFRHRIGCHQAMPSYYTNYTNDSEQLAAGAESTVANGAAHAHSLTSTLPAKNTPTHATHTPANSLDFLHTHTHTHMGTAHNKHDTKKISNSSLCLDENKLNSQRKCLTFTNCV